MMRKTYRIRPERVLELLRSWRLDRDGKALRMAGSAIPDDAQAVWAAVEPTTGTILLIVESQQAEGFAPEILGAFPPPEDCHTAQLEQIWTGPEVAFAAGHLAAMMQREEAKAT